MIASMTGFARRERSGPLGDAHLRAASVNHRYLELALRLPEELRPLEGDARTLLSTNLRRGKVEACIYLRSSRGRIGRARAQRSPWSPSCKQRAAEVAQTARRHPRRDRRFDVLRWPGVLRETDRDPEPVATGAMSLFAETVAELKRMRAREGARLARLIDSAATRCASCVATGARAAAGSALAHPARGLPNARHNWAPRSIAERIEQEIALLACNAWMSSRRARPPGQSRRRDPAGVRSRSQPGGASTS